MIERMFYHVNGMRRASQRAYNVRYYAANRDRELARVRAKSDRWVRILRDMRRVPCDDCGGTFEPHLMDFDHRDPATKTFDILRRVGGVTRSRLVTEIEKCDIVCANCHKIRSYARAMVDHIERVRAKRGIFARKRYSRSAGARNDVALLERIRDTTCADCGRRFPFYVMEFDHRESSLKSFGIVESAGRHDLVTLFNELAKCDIVCTNCHRDRTTLRREVSRE